MAKERAKKEADQKAVSAKNKSIQSATVSATRPSAVSEAMTDAEHAERTKDYGKRAADLLKHSWSQHDVSKEKAKAGDKEGAEKSLKTSSRAHKLFLKARDKYLAHPAHAEAHRNKVMSGISAYYASKKPGEYTGD